MNTIPALYKKLLTLYPRAFKEVLEESMEQTFNDLYKERQIEHGWFSFVLWTFSETAIGIVQENILSFKEINPMKNILTNLGSPALISLLLVIPFMILEVVSTRNLNAIFNVPLFGILWFLPTAFLLILMPMVRNVQAGNSLMARPISLLVSMVFLIFIAFMWGGIVLDQLPCFLGIPNCD
ncbi:MAG: hypothetical protein EHM33_05595 [Chloroflexi bacterium]|nr:MAG: hypothetical protein EHM33_05595 [Chloroflexota bacterium]